MDELLRGLQHASFALGMGQLRASGEVLWRDAGGGFSTLLAAYPVEAELNTHHGLPAADGEAACVGEHGWSRLGGGFLHSPALWTHPNPPDTPCSAGSSGIGDGRNNLDMCGNFRACLSFSDESVRSVCCHSCLGADLCTLHVRSLTRPVN